MQTGEPFYRMSNLTKRYLDNTALSEINISFGRGKVSGLIGKNGAGKSTLVNIMYGALEQSSGRIFIDGHEVGPLTPAKAQQLGVYLVPQKVQHIHGLTIAENLFLGRYPRNSMGFIDTGAMNREAKDVMSRLGLSISPGFMMGKLNLEQRRLLDVAKALWVYNAKMIILDETTAALGLSSKKRLFEVIERESHECGRSVVFITHRLKEIMEICDDVSVLRDGRMAGFWNIGETSADVLAEAIIGEKQDISSIGNNRGVTERTGGEVPLLEVKNLGRRNKFSSVSFTVRENEIVGLSGMLGSGYNDILRCIGGVGDEKMEGDILIAGRKVGSGTPERAGNSGIAYLTNNREEEGLFHSMTIEENMFCGAYRDFENRFGFLSRQKIGGMLAERVRSLDIKLQSPSLLIDSLSGGNKQKVLVSRLLNRKSKILLLDELAEGIDIEARMKLLRFIDEVVRKNHSVIMASNVVEDIVTICDRILIISHGRLVRIFERHEYDEQELYSAIQGLRDPA